MVAGKVRSSSPSWSGNSSHKEGSRNHRSMEDRYDEKFRRQMEAEQNQKLLEDEAAAWLMSPAGSSSSSSSSTSPSFSFSQRFITAAAAAASSLSASTPNSSSKASMVSSSCRSSPTMFSDKDDRSNSRRRHFFPSSEFNNNIREEEARSLSTNSTCRTESMQSRSRSSSGNSLLQRKESLKDRAIRERIQSMPSQRSVKVGANCHDHHRKQDETTATSMTVTPTWGGGGGTYFPDEMRVSPATIMSTSSEGEGDGDTTLRSLSTRTRSFPVEKEFKNKLLISVVSLESGTSSSDHTRSKANHSRQVQKTVDNKKGLTVSTALPPPRKDKKGITNHQVEAKRESLSQHNKTSKSDSDSSQRSAPMSLSSKMQSIGRTSSETMHSCPTDERTVENKRFFAPSSSFSSLSRPVDVVQQQDQQQDCSAPESIEIEVDNDHFLSSSSSTFSSPIYVNQRNHATKSIETEEVIKKKKKSFGRRKSSSALDTLKVDLPNGINRRQGSRRKTFGYSKMEGREDNVEEEAFNNSWYGQNLFPNKVKVTITDKETASIHNQVEKTKVVVREKSNDDPLTSSSSHKRRQQNTTMPARSKEKEKIKVEDTSAAAGFYKQAIKTKIVMVQEKTKDPFKSSSSHKRRQQQPTTMPVRTNRIKLNVYDLLSNEVIMPLPWGIEFPIGQCFGVVNAGLHNLGTGAYHVGVEINGVEYAYGCNQTEGATGIFSCMPKNSPGYQYRTTIDLGERVLVRDVVENNNSSHGGNNAGNAASQNTVAKRRHVDGREVIREMAEDYMGVDYDLLRKNCCTFAHDACLRLGVASEEIPSWFRNLCSAGALAQDAANMKFEPLTEAVSKWGPDIDIDAPFDNACNLIGPVPNLLPNNENDIGISNTKKG